MAEVAFCRGEALLAQRQGGISSGQLSLAGSLHPVLCMVSLSLVPAPEVGGRLKGLPGPAVCPALTLAIQQQLWA